MKDLHRIRLGYVIVILIPVGFCYLNRGNINIYSSVLFLALDFMVILSLGYSCYITFTRPYKRLRKMADNVFNQDYQPEPLTQVSEDVEVIFASFEKMHNEMTNLETEKQTFERDTRELISNISHDLKTPLTAIKGYAEGIMDGVASTPDKIEKYLKTIYTKANDMTVLIDELSMYSKINREDVQYNFVAVNLNSFFSDCISDLTLDLEVRDTNIIYLNCTDSELLIYADVEQIKRVIHNIIGNSVKYIGHKKGMIKVMIEDEPDEVHISIVDNGIGVRKEELPKLFERFYRTDASRNSTKGGSGLGLAIAKKIIEDHGCKIWAEGEYGIGLGIHFTMKKYKGIE